MGTQYHHERKVDKPKAEPRIEEIGQERKVMSLKPSETRKNTLPLIEERIRECESTLSGLEKYLHDDDIDSYGISRLSKDVFNADKRFTALKNMLEQGNYTLNMLDRGRYIENNLEKLKGSISMYRNAGRLSKIMISGAVSVLGFLAAYSYDGSFGGDVGSMIIVDVFCGAFLGGISYVIMNGIEANPGKYFVQGSHKNPINNISKYSDLFFDDLREKMK